MRIQLEEVVSGSNEDSYWVTLGFRSPEQESDTLHLVCGKEDDMTRCSNPVRHAFLGGYRGRDQDHSFFNHEAGRSA